MTPLSPRRNSSPFGESVIEVVFIIFLFYSNLLMGEFTGVNGQGKTFAFALRDIITPTNFLIALSLRVYRLRDRRVLAAQALKESS